MMDYSDLITAARGYVPPRLWQQAFRVYAASAILLHGNRPVWHVGRKRSFV